MRFWRIFFGQLRSHIVILFIFRCNLLTTVQSDSGCKRGLISSLDKIVLRFDLRQFEEEESLVVGGSIKYLALTFVVIGGHGQGDGGRDKVNKL